MTIKEEIEKNGWPCGCQQQDALGRISHIKMHHQSVERCRECGCTQADVIEADGQVFSASTDAPPVTPRRRQDDALVLYVIYCAPADYPDDFVVRRWQGETCDGEPFGLFKTVGAARAALPAGLANIGRRELDDPVIVEVWL